MTVTAPRDPRRAKGAAGVSAVALAIATAMIAAHEGEVRIPYVDRLGRGQPLSVCYGETHGVEQREYSHAECMAMLERSALKHAEAISPCLPPGLPDQTAAAFYDFGYNVGATTFCKSSVSRKAKAGDLAGACRAIGLYVYSGGRDCRIKANRCGGIVKRRQDEIALCLKGVG
jgi:lysozyme